MAFACRGTGDYYDLEQPGTVAMLDAQWEEVVASRELVILDEAQSAPDIFPRLHSAIDDQRGRKGRGTKRQIKGDGLKGVLQSIYEQDFLGFSYGFRPGRSQHQALDALSVAITSKKVNCVARR